MEMKLREAHYVTHSWISSQLLRISCGKMAMDVHLDFLGGDISKKDKDGGDIQALVDYSHLLLVCCYFP